MKAERHDHFSHHSISPQVSKHRHGSQGAEKKYCLLETGISLERQDSEHIPPVILAWQEGDSPENEEIESKSQILGKWKHV